MKKFAHLVLACSVLAATGAAHADTLNGTTTTGNITLVGPFTTASAVIGSGVEFTTALPHFKYSADFSDTGLLFTVSCTGTNLQCLPNGAVDYTATFTDAAFAGGTFSSTLANGTGILDYSFSQNGSTLSITGLAAAQGSEALAFTPSVAVTPEPSSLALLGTGVLGAVGVIRRRIRA